MSTETSTATAPIIPVTDERIEPHPDATQDHREKVKKFNELLEEIHERKMELAKLEATIVDMRQEIVEETQIYSGEEPTKAVDEGEEDADAQAPADDTLSDGSDKVSDKEKKDKRKKTRTKGKGRERTWVAGSEMSVDWDYRLDLSSKNGRRSSDANETLESPIEALPPRSRVTLGSH